MSDNKIMTHMAKHPKATGILFTVLFLLAQAGSAAANESGWVGP